MYVIQIVGFKNSGKTTLINQWIEYLTNKQYDVATIKHHGHGGDPSYDQQTDSYQHFQHGAEMTTVIGEKSLSMIGTNKKLSFSSILELYEKLGVDIVMIEGYKNLPLPKIVLLRDQKDMTLVDDTEAVQYIFTNRMIKQNVFSVPCFTQPNALFEQIDKEWETFAYLSIKSLLPYDEK